ncbi:MAG: class I poly(R)-hydroxyalkanoic acid synthase [Methyloceanibacter sp.]|jgi:polyhydroxyalkanoate synthase|uniref:PHA/PHB synthase family protein n=1 Tax=Methyloceanibacter sp. TaxID=1965321 RepID=UPI003C5CF0D4
MRDDNRDGGAGTTGAKGSDNAHDGKRDNMNFDEFARNMFRLFDQGAKVASSLAERNASNGKGPYGMASEAGEAAKSLGSVAQAWATNPGKLAAAQGELMQSYADLWGRSMRKFLGEDVEPLAEPEPGDNRFKDPGWSENQYFDFWKQAYLITSRWAEDVTANTEGVDDKTRRKAMFYLEHVLSAMSPSNNPLTNPEVVRTTLSTNAENLVQGMTLLAEDLDQSKDLLRVSQTDLSAFEVGRDLAITPGKVIFQNELIQLIQYDPTTEQVSKTPLIIAPPWINKYYILDLKPEKSLVKYAVDQGFTVFMISWVNPDEKLAQKSFEDYMHEGILKAVEVVNRQLGVHHVNLMGYCVGGTLLASTLAYAAAKGDERISTATFLTAQVDFSEAGDLLMFIDDAQLKSLEEMMSERGFLDGSRMAAVFNMLRPRDLIWPYVVNNYLLGKKPFPFDLLFWNADSTRLPAANHAFYLREFYHENRLSKGEMELGGVKLDLSKVNIPIYELFAREDHIAPAASVFRGSRLFGGDVRQVMAGSGHIAGVVNPPAKKKYQHWTGAPAETLDEWIETATEVPGSWWPDWAAWLQNLSGEKVPARDPSAGVFEPIEDAPGSYVKSHD